MDFRAGGREDDGLRFMYVLPFTPTRALVEDTSLGGGARSPDDRRAAIAAHLRDVWDAGAAQVVREERGTLPMTTHPYAAVLGPRVLAVGAAGGRGAPVERLRLRAPAAPRPGRRPGHGRRRAAPARVGRRRHARLDALFLRALAGDPAGFDRHLLALAGGVGAGTFARFMTDASGVRDEAEVVAALTRPGFLRAMAFPGAPRTRPARADAGGARARGRPGPGGARARGRPGAGAAHRDVTARRWTLPGWATLAAIALLAVASPGAARAAGWVPFLLGLVVFSCRTGPSTTTSRAGSAGRAAAPSWRPTVAGVAAVLALWALAPVATFAGFLVGGRRCTGAAGDGWYARVVHGRPPFSGRVDAALFVAARGALPGGPARARASRRAGPGRRRRARAVGAGPLPLLAEPVRAAGLAAVGLLVGAAALSAARSLRDRPRAALLDLGELAALTAFFLLTPALLAVGTYLLAWHAPRHVARLIAADPAQAALSPLSGLWAWAREAAPLTALSLAGLALLAGTAWQVPAAADAVGGGALALIAALTLPHAAVVAWMDREQAVWGARPAGR
jgi:Brp/Blh family beta-carotene 15,15'-monooxygenase